MDILELYHNDTSRLHPLLAVVSDIYENNILCWKIVRELKMGGLTAKRRWWKLCFFSIFCVDYIFPLLLLLQLLPDCLRRMVAKTPFVPFQLATTQLLGEAEGYFVLHFAVQASTIFWEEYFVLQLPPSPQTSRGCYPGLSSNYCYPT